MFKKLFGQKEKSVRILDNAENLQIGDMLEMVDSFGLPEQIRGKTLQVMSVSTYEYDNEREYEFILQGDDANTVHMTIENEDGEKFANFTLKIERDEVERLFDMNTFSQVFEEDLCREAIAVVGNAQSYDRWLASSYRQQSQWYKGYFHHQKDYRNTKVSAYVDDNSEAFEAVTLISDDEMHYVGIEVWEDGETDICLGMVRPFADIQALYGKT